jgi:hypothetical protein
MELRPRPSRWWLRLATAALVAIAAISIAAVLDHRHKDAVRRSVNGAEWYCVHHGLRCAEARRSASVERRWNRRETFYKGSIAVLAGVIVVMGAMRLAARPARGSNRQ